MKVHKVIVGYLDTNCYILIKDKKCLVIDPGDEADKIIDEIKGYSLQAILVTHYHSDHVGALKDLLEYAKVPVMDAYHTKEQNYQIGPFSFEVIHTPGHTSDSITFYFEEEKIMFVGDFIFLNGIGRMDLPTGDRNEMKKSIEKIKEYPGNIKCYPGHGEYTTIQESIEFRKNIGNIGL